MDKKVKQYYSQVPEQAKAKLDELRTIAVELLPQAREVMCYGIPTFKINGQSVVGIGGWNNFVSLYPYGSAQIIELKKELASYRTTKGAIQFGLDKALPDKLIAKIVNNKLKSLGIK